MGGSSVRAHVGGGARLVGDFDDREGLVRSVGSVSVELARFAGDFLPPAGGRRDCARPVVESGAAARRR